MSEPFKEPSDPVRRFGRFLNMTVGLLAAHRDDHIAPCAGCGVCDLVNTAMRYSRLTDVEFSALWSKIDIIVEEQL